MFHSIGHVGIYVRDMETSLKFYRDVLGLKVLEDLTLVNSRETDNITGIKQTKLRVVIVKSGEGEKATPIELMQFLDSPNSSLDLSAHPYNPGRPEVSFLVSNIDGLYEQLRVKGVQFHCPPQLFAGEGYRVKATYFRDPDGTILELMEEMGESRSVFSS